MIRSRSGGGLVESQIVFTPATISVGMDDPPGGSTDTPTADADDIPVTTFTTDVWPTASAPSDTGVPARTVHNWNTLPSEGVASALIRITPLSRCRENATVTLPPVLSG